MSLGDAPELDKHPLGDAQAPQEQDEVALVTSILSQLSRVDAAARGRILETVATFYGIGIRQTAQPSASRSGPNTGPSGMTPSFSEDRSISPKKFMAEKQPTTDVEKVACLAYYLTHYRNTPHFKTLDISKLNTEAAQIKFANAANAVENATKRNYLAAASKGTKQLSAAGEQFVQVLPDREKAKSAMSSARPRRRARKPESEDDQT